MNDKRKPISLVIKNIETEEECEKLFEERKKRKEMVDMGLNNNWIEEQN